jgi:glutamyl-tRNA reductase
LQAIADSGRKEREKQLYACEQIIESQLTKYGFVG